MSYPPEEMEAPPQGRPRGSSGGLRVPPHNRDAEESVLGSLLLSVDAVNLVMDRLGPDDFYVPAHGAVFEAILDLYSANQPIDAVTVADVLRRKEELERMGGLRFLTDLSTAVPTAANVEYYAEIVSEQSVRRRLLNAGGQIGLLATETDRDVDIVIDEAEQVIFKVAERRVGESLQPISAHIDRTLEQIEEFETRGTSVIGLPTGFRDLDARLSGLQGSNLIVIASRPGMGKSALSLNIARNIALDGGVVAVFSMEMSQEEIIQRLICSTGRIDSGLLRSGRLGADQWPRVLDAAGKMFNAPIYVDDSSYVTVTDVRAKCRRLKRSRGLDVVVVDYLQLMQGRSKENRQQEIAEISRGLKNLARELNVPIIAISQLNRALEQRQDKRPQLGDLRECLTAETPVQRADTGETITIGEIAREGLQDIPVLSLGEDYQLVPSLMSEAWSTGEKQIFRLATASGRSVRASGNHPFLTLGGWRRLEELEEGATIAVPRSLPEPMVGERMHDDELVVLAHMIGDGSALPQQALRYSTGDPANLGAVRAAAIRRFGVVTAVDTLPDGSWSLRMNRVPALHGRHNPIREWMRNLGVYGLRSHQKRLPAEVFRLPLDQVRFFLRHLWATDGSVTVRSDESRCRIYYASNSEQLARGVARLLLRLGISARVKEIEQGDYRPMWNVDVSGADQQRRFLHGVGCHGARDARARHALQILDGKTANTNVDAVPLEVWDDIRALLREKHISHRALAAGLEMSYCGSSLFKTRPSRERLRRVARVVDDQHLVELSESDVLWDPIVSIVPDGVEETFDAVVPGTHNFIAGDMIVHNSGAIEQDSDIVMFIYRDEYYNPESDQRGTAEISIAKHRAGATGRFMMSFAPSFTAFGDLARDATV